MELPRGVTPVKTTVTFHIPQTREGWEQTLRELGTEAPSPLLLATMTFLPGESETRLLDVVSEYRPSAGESIWTLERQPPPRSAPPEELVRRSSAVGDVPGCLGVLGRQWAPVAPVSRHFKCFLGLDPTLWWPEALVPRPRKRKLPKGLRLALVVSTFKVDSSPLAHVAVVEMGEGGRPGISAEGQRRMPFHDGIFTEVEAQTWTLLKPFMTKTKRRLPTGG